MYFFILANLALPLIRQRCDRDLRHPQLTRDQVLAVVVQLLDETLIRVGNAEYAQQNSSYGLTTLRDRHVEIFRTSSKKMGLKPRPRRTALKSATIVTTEHEIRVLSNCTLKTGYMRFCTEKLVQVKYPSSKY